MFKGFFNFAAQTKVMTTVVAGNVNLDTEQIDVIIRAKPREGFLLSVFRLQCPGKSIVQGRSLV